MIECARGLFMCVLGGSLTDLLRCHDADGKG